MFFADGAPPTSASSSSPGYDARRPGARDKRIRVPIGGQEPDHPVLGPPPRRPTIIGVRLHLGARLRRRAAAARPRRARRCRSTARRRSSSTSTTTWSRSAATGAAHRHRDRARDRTANGDRPRRRRGHAAVHVSATGTSGPPRISFEVTDGESATDPTGTPARSSPPIDVEPAREPAARVQRRRRSTSSRARRRSIDLVRLTNYPYADDLDELVYSVLDPRPRASRSRSTASSSCSTADETTVTGRVRPSIDRGAGRRRRGPAGPHRPAASCRRRARSPQPAADDAVAARGQTTTSTCSPTTRRPTRSPSTPLRVIGIRGLDGGACPTASASRRAPTSSHAHRRRRRRRRADRHDLQYQVADATDDPDRYAWGTVTISVQDRPDPVTERAGDRSSATGCSSSPWAPGGFNNSPITGYEVTLVDPAAATVLGDLDVHRDHLHAADAGQRPGQRRARPRVVAQRDRALRSSRGAGPDLVRHHPAAAAALGRRRSTAGSRHLDEAADGTGAGSPSTSYVVTVGAASRARSTPQDAVGTAYSRERHRVPGASRTARRSVHGQRAQRGVPGARHVDRGRRQRHARSGRRSRRGIDRHGRRGGRRGHGVVGAVRRQRRRRSAATTCSGSPTAQTAMPSGAAGLLGHESRPGDVVRLRAAAPSPRSSRSGRMPRACSSPARCTESTRYSFVVWGFNRAPARTPRSRASSCDPHPAR